MLAGLQQKEWMELTPDSCARLEFSPRSPHHGTLSKFEAVSASLFTHRFRSLLFWMSRVQLTKLIVSLGCFSQDLKAEEEDFCCTFREVMAKPELIVPPDSDLVAISRS